VTVGIAAPEPCEYIGKIGRGIGYL